MRMVGRSGDAGGKRVPEINISLSWMHNVVRLTNNTMTNLPEREEETVSNMIIILSLCCSQTLHMAGAATLKLLVC